MRDVLNATLMDFLKANGPRMDSEIAEALGIPLTQVRSRVVKLASSGDVICCDAVRFEHGARVEGISCRLSCYTPPVARGRKPGANRKAAADPASE